MMPNILFFTTHDLGQHLGIYGRRTVDTPALDALGAEGVVFERSFCTAPQCSPSRAALHTGRFPHATGMLGLAHSTFAWRLNPDEQHIAARLRAAGCETALMGIQHVAGHDEVSTLGYDHIFPLAPARQMAQTAAHFLADPARHERPFYLEIGFVEPHRPYDYAGTPPDERKGIDLPAYIPDTPEARAEFAQLQGMIKAMDEGVGIVLEALAANGLAEDTWVIFTADHGLAMPRAKCTLYDPGIETALLMRWPARGLVGGRRLDPLISNIDIVPTLLEGLGLPAAETAHGRSFWPLLQGAPYQPNAMIFAEQTFHTSYEPLRGVRTERYKLIANLDQGITAIPSDIRQSPIYPQMMEVITQAHPYLELYDLQADPAERENLAGRPDMAAVEAELRGHLLRWMEATGDPLLAGPPASPFYRAALDALRG